MATTGHQKAVGSRSNQKNVDLMEAIERFIKDKRFLQGVTPRTLVWYRLSLRMFAPALRAGATKDAVMAVIEDMVQRGVSPVTINTYTRAVNSFLTWAAEERFIVEHRRIKRLREPLLKYRILEYSEIGRLVSARASGMREARALTIALLILDTGMRINEVLHLEWDRVSLENNTVRVFGKGRRERIVPLSERGCAAMHRWERYTEINRGLVFPSKRGTVLNYSNIDDDFHHLLARLGIAPCGFHALRHTFATLYLRAGGDVLTLQSILGHSSLEMTKRYVSLSPEDLRVAHGRFSPLARSRAAGA